MRKLLDLLFETAAPHVRGPVGVLRAVPHAGLGPLRAHDLSLAQSFKPLADALEKESFSSEIALPDQMFNTILLIGNRYKKDLVRQLAAARTRLEADGRLIVALHNDHGGKSLGKILTEQGFDLLSQATGGHGRVVVAQKIVAQKNTAVPAELATAPLFAPEKQDAGTALLGENLPDKMPGKRGADLGAGDGALMHFLLPKIAPSTKIDLFEADHDALQVACHTFEKEEKATVTFHFAFHWHDVTAGLAGHGPYDWIVTNPPFHDLWGEDRSLGLKFIEAAAKVLKPGGRLYLVANRHLPYEATLSGLFATHETLAEIGGYKVIAARKGASG